MRVRASEAVTASSGTSSTCSSSLSSCCRAPDAATTPPPTAAKAPTPRAPYRKCRRVSRISPPPGVGTRTPVAALAAQRGGAGPAGPARAARRPRPQCRPRPPSCRGPSAPRASPAAAKAPCCLPRPSAPPARRGWLARRLRRRAWPRMGAGMCGSLGCHSVYCVISRTGQSRVRGNCYNKCKHDLRMRPMRARAIMVASLCRPMRFAGKQNELEEISMSNETRRISAG